MKTLLALLMLFSFGSGAETITVSNVTYELVPGAPSCGFLVQRDLERQKVIRELDFLFQQSLKGDVRSLLFSDSLLTNKLFLDPSVSSDASVTVHLTATVGPRLAAQIQKGGLASTFLITDGPGVIWQSLATQLPSDMSIAFVSDKNELHLDYKIYESVLCSKPLVELETPTIVWIENPDEYLDSMTAADKLNSLP